VLLDCLMPGLDGFDVARALRGQGGSAPRIVIMLTSLNERGDRDRCRELGIADFLVKPVSPSTLYDAIVTAVGKVPRERGLAREEHDHALQIAGVARGMRILLAEDNAINVAVVDRLLRRVGLEIEVAGTGRRALDAIAREPFDLVLMDVQMPELDGVEATRRVRDLEKGKGRRTPIVALTAHSMRGDKERFLAAGMDDYLAKPFSFEDLARILGRIRSARLARPKTEG
jgi:two-component system, sensor histidine kinase and response regulator